MYKKTVSFGKLPDGQDVNKISINGDNIEIDVIDYGCIITAIRVPDRNGNMTDVVLGQNSPADYIRTNAFFGAVVGPIAGRVGNGSYYIGRQLFNLEKNERGTTHLHGASAGLDKVIWNIESLSCNEESAEIVFVTNCDNSSKGYPGNVSFKVSYTVKDSGELIIDYCAVSDKLTPVNMTNHTYFNLNGESSGKNVLNHSLKINSDFYLPLKKNSIPTGEVHSVAGTPFDFRDGALLGDNIKEEFEQLRQFDGFDHPILLKYNSDGLPQASAYNSENGIKLDVYTDQNSLVLYTCNGMDGSISGKDNTKYTKYYAFCFETQGMPDALNNKHFPSVLIGPDRNYSQKTVWRFSAE